MCFPNINDLQNHECYHNHQLFSLTTVAEVTQKHIVMGDKGVNSCDTNNIQKMSAQDE